jgi:acyl-CoA synthetase (AMP-forming)/AMP-acid ligase II
VPKTVTVIREVPVSASGKPDKRALGRALSHRTGDGRDGTLG